MANMLIECKWFQELKFENKVFILWFLISLFCIASTQITWVQFPQVSLERGIVEFVCLITNNFNFLCSVVLSLNKTRIVFGRVLRMPFKSWQRTRHEIIRVRLRIIHECHKTERYHPKLIVNWWQRDFGGYFWHWGISAPSLSGVRILF
jgi:hypothetical protein